MIDCIFGEMSVCEVLSILPATNRRKHAVEREVYVQ